MTLDQALNHQLVVVFQTMLNLTIIKTILTMLVNNGQSIDESELITKIIEGRAKIKFEDNFDDQESSPGHIVFEDDAKYDEINLNYIDDDERDLQSSGKPITFENQDDDFISNTRNPDPDKNPATERLVFADRPFRRPKSLPERAVSAVAEALTSIALYDDQQCVPKILCEVAGGSSTASSPMLLKASASLQPLLSLLQAYNGVSSSPLFIFSRAAIMGLTAKGNPSECRRAYPQCPNDPEKLINYLNNHNGGFFRFFGQPQVPQKQQNLEQFYNYLSGQYGFQQQTQQNYGLLNQFSYGFLPQNGNLYNQGYTQNSYRNSNTSESEIEERIQNKPGVNVLDDNDDDFYEDQDKGSKWSFPDQVETKKPKYIEYNRINEPARPPRSSKTLKFPDDKTENRLETYRPRDYPRKQKNIFFPEQNDYQINNNYQTTPVNLGEYIFDHKHGFYVKRPKATTLREAKPTANNNDNVVYIVRGNGDPNHPEIVKVRPGQSIYT
ncbi:uncharacterized protein LOC124641063 [Helicoverpa zea]|uniref:uncharacterized protein LOC124641063 n=1 Tax=Helicoverpa zea TaxID=7113 RepID=UPI001F59D320|nr:uncharacterized protein LOC124641063 [Helicoverpa zea]